MKKILFFVVALQMLCHAYIINWPNDTIRVGHLRFWTISDSSTFDSATFNKIRVLNKMYLNQDSALLADTFLLESSDFLIVDTADNYNGDYSGSTQIKSNIIVKQGYNTNYPAFSITKTLNPPILMIGHAQISAGQHYNYFGSGMYYDGSNYEWRTTHSSPSVIIQEPNGIYLSVPQDGALYSCGDSIADMTTDAQLHVTDVGILFKGDHDFQTINAGDNVTFTLPVIFDSLVTADTIATTGLSLTNLTATNSNVTNLTTTASAITAGIDNTGQIESDTILSHKTNIRASSEAIVNSGTLLNIEDFGDYRQSVGFYMYEPTTNNAGEASAFLGTCSQPSSFVFSTGGFANGSGTTPNLTNAMTATATSSSMYYIFSGYHLWFGNTGLTKGNDFTSSELMRVTPTGDLALGTSSSNYKFTMYKATGTNGMQFITGATGATALDGTLLYNNNKDFIVSNLEDACLTFSTDNTPRIVVTGGGRIGVNTLTDTSHQFTVSGGIKGDTLYSGSTSHGVTIDSIRGVKLYGGARPFDIVGAMPFTAGKGSPTWTATGRGMSLYQFTVGDSIQACAEIGHRFAEDDTTFFNVHYVTNGTEGSDKYVNWSLHYFIINVGDTVTHTGTLTKQDTITAGTATLTHKMVQFAPVYTPDPTIDAGIAVVIKRIASTSEPAADPFGSAVNVLKRVDGLGSTTLYTK